MQIDAMDKMSKFCSCSTVPHFYSVILALLPIKLYLQKQAGAKEAGASPTRQAQTLSRVCSDGPIRGGLPVFSLCVLGVTVAAQSDVLSV